MTAIDATAKPASAAVHAAQVPCAESIPRMVAMHLRH
jgi:hypothetical protein